MVSAAACPGIVAPLLCLLAGLLAGLLGWVAGRPRGIAYTLDISGVGQVRLTVYQQTGAVVRLLDGSTLWPGLLLLRLRGDDGRVHTLVVLPDSVARADWRALALACRAVAQINTPAV